MKKTQIFGFVLVLLLIASAVFFPRSGVETPAAAPGASGQESPDRKAQKALTRRARDAYFNQMLRDPATDAIPDGIRAREVAFARTLPRRADVPAKSGAMALFAWHEAGPSGIGGRTRALALDAANSNTILAAGVTGGIWKSTNAGASWTLRSDTEEMLNITAIAQDPRPGNRNRWYAGGGELRGSASDNGGRAFIYGNGIFVSDDNGDSWQLAAFEEDQNPTSFDSPYDYVHRIVVSPTNGFVYLAANGYGIWRSINQGQTFAPQIGPFGLLPMWSDVAVASDGTLVAVLSSGFVENPTEAPGIYRSTDNGATWSNITPAGFPAEHERSVVVIPPSNPNAAYVLTYTGESVSNGDPFDEETIVFFKLNLAAGTAEDRSANLPDFGPPVGVMSTQFNYNMTMAVSPADENFLLIGGINLFRSRDGFATPASAPIENWVGGYDINNNIAQYANQHADQHAIVFDPAAPARVWTGHDGGISVTENIAVSGTRVVWSRRNDGYHVTQYYHVSLSPEAGDDRILGGTQDNGSPFFRFDPTTSVAGVSNDLTSGDGAYSYLGTEYGLASSQQGRLLRYGLNETSGSPFFTDELTPPDAADQLFINPIAVDALDETFIYYPAGRTLWRYDEEAPGSEKWTQLTNLTVPAGFVISALRSGARDTGAGVRSTLYYAASSFDAPPLVFRLDNSTTATNGAVALAPPEIPSGAYVHEFAVNPEDGNEVMVVVSNYNVESLYHSVDGGATFTGVDGNLGGAGVVTGPSIRAAAILPVNTGTVYLAGSSTGIYATETLNGSATVWVQEADAELGNAIVQSIAARTSDGRVALGTHGRGVFVGSSLLPVPIETIDSQPAAAYVLDQNYPNPFNPGTEIGFSLPAASRVRLVVFDVAGRAVATLVDGRILDAGTHRASFSASSLASGAYIYTLEATPVAGDGGSPVVLSKAMTLAR